MLKRKQSEIRFPLEQKLLLVVIPLIALSLMAVSVITYRVAKQNIQNRVSEYMEQYLLQLSSAIDNKLGNVDPAQRPAFGQRAAF